MPNSKQRYSNSKCSPRQARAIKVLTLTEEWPLLVELLESRLFDAQVKLEAAGKDDFRYEQGRVAELRTVLGLEGSAEAVIEAERNPRRSSGF